MAIGEDIPKLQALKTDITVTRADVVYNGQTLLEWWTHPAGDTELARFYQQVHVPEYWVYRTDLSEEAVLGQVSPGGTSFIFTGNGFISRSVQELMVWDKMFRNGTVDASKPNNRAAFQDILSGTGNAAANRAHIGHHARRLANYGEVLYAIGGAGSTGDPATMTFQGDITADDVGHSHAV